uniref:Citrate synthase n=1 Tax=Spumella elongata TaxID=89044 RepID=A0A7S3HK22_9STRA
MSTKSLKEILKDQIPLKQEAMKKLKAEYGHRSLGEVTVDQCIGGGRDVKCMYYETSLLDANEGIRFRGYSIPELQAKLPTFKGPAGQGEPLPEALIWLLLTSEIPTVEQTRSLTEELNRRSKLPANVEPLIRSLPKNMHPMTQLSIAVMACQTESKFAAAYASGVHKAKYWEYALEDILDVIAKMPEIAALIYRCTFKDGVVKKDTTGKLDYSAQFNRMLGYDTPDFDELMRLYLVIHSDHEGGNASAHTTHLVGSTLSDPYLAISAGLNALAGPLHGLANQEVLSWIQQLQAKFQAEGKEVNKETITAFAWETLKAGKVIPGYGHAVLRKTDPRYECQRQFALKYLPEDPLFKIVNTIYDVMPGVLTEHGKTKNPYPNVDSHSGVLLWHYGFTDFQYYTVLFGVSRAMGALSQVFWDRALGMPLERPKSVTADYIVNYFKDKK